MFALSSTIYIGGGSGIGDDLKRVYPFDCPKLWMQDNAQIVHILLSFKFSQLPVFSTYKILKWYKQ